VAKINGRLLTGNGLQAFQLKRQTLSTSAAPGGDLSGVGVLGPSHAAFLYESRLISLRWDNIGVAFVVLMVFFS
jgi:hypothetical protein